MKSLTLRQQGILDFIDGFREEHGYAPSIRDIVKGCQISSTSVVDYNLRILQRGGHLRRDAEISRGIVRIGGSERSGRAMVPVLGQIAAGSPIPVPSSDTWRSDGEGEYVEVTPGLTKGRDGVFALRVKGTSMIDALISDGDMVLFQAAGTAENGEMVAVWLKEQQEVTLKKIYYEDGRVRLQPANVTMEPIYTTAGNVEIQGKGVGGIRQI